MKQKFDIIISTCVPLPLENVDTDQIIPARFLKATDKEGFGDNLFATGDTTRTVIPSRTSFSMTPPIMDVSWWQARTSVPVPVVSMLPGPLRAMAFAWSSVLFLLISTKTTNSITSFCPYRSLMSSFPNSFRLSSRIRSLRLRSIFLIRPLRISRQVALSTLTSMAIRNIA